MLARWKSSSGPDPTGEETAHAERATLIEVIAITVQRKTLLSFKVFLNLYLAGLLFNVESLWVPYCSRYQL
jgi:hypothetical protein